MLYFLDLAFIQCTATRSILQYYMDLLVQQKIHAAMQPLFEKIHSLQQQLSNMAQQIQTLQNENHLKNNSNLSSTIQVQTQQSRVEHKTGGDKSRISKQPTAEKVTTKKENNGAKAQPKMEVPQNHGTKKEVKRQPAKSFKANIKENKTDSHLSAEKPKKPLDQKQSQKVMKQPQGDMSSKVKTEAHQQNIQKMNDTNIVQKGKQKAEESTQNHSDVNQMKENIQMTTGKHSNDHSGKESTNGMQEQEEMLIPSANNEEVNIVIMPSTLADSIVYQIQNSIQPQTQSHQNQKVDTKNQTTEKEEPKESHSKVSQSENKTQTSHATEKAQQTQHDKKQDHKPSTKPIKEHKTFSYLPSKKQPNFHKKTEENCEKLNKSNILHKQKMETKQKKDSTKDSNIKQKTLGKSVDPAKKIKAKEEPKTEKKVSESTKTENALNEEDMEKGKQEVQKQHDDMLQHPKGEVQA